LKGTDLKKLLLPLETFSCPSCLKIFISQLHLDAHLPQHDKVKYEEDGNAIDLKLGVNETDSNKFQIEAWKEKDNFPQKLG
jgi:hypothetical protein